MPRHSHLAAVRNSMNLPYAKDLRSGMTRPEWKLWYYLRARRFEGRKFRRQVPVGDYIADFLCEEVRVIVEVDGGQHADRLEYDAARTEWLRGHGYSVVRFWNHDVMGDIEGVLEALSIALAKRETLSPALSQGRGST